MTDLLRRLGIERPIIQAPMAGTSTPQLAAAVSNAGGLGSVALGAVDVAGARQMIAAVLQATSGPFNVNLFCHRPASPDAEREARWLRALAPTFARFGAEPPGRIGEIYTSFNAVPEMLELLLELRPPVASFHFGLPPKAAIERLKRVGVFLLATATSLSEARAAVAAGVDAIVAQGWEAGGHRGVFNLDVPDRKLSLNDLLRQLTGSLSTPVIAAGGIMDGSDVAAALARGAQAAQLGTAFVGCPESNADRFHREALFGPGAGATVMTDVLSGRPARCLPNGFTALAAGPLSHLDPPDYPIAYDAGKALAAAARAHGDGSFSAQWAGQGAPRARALPASDLMAALTAELAGARG